MQKRKIHNIIECPQCSHHFDEKYDVLNKLCKQCKQWRPIIDFPINKNVCKTCLGIRVIRFSSQLRIRTKEGRLLKKCQKCQLWKPESSYSKQKKSKDGLSGWCKDCQKRRKPKTAN